MPHPPDDTSDAPKTSPPAKWGRRTFLKAASAAAVTGLVGGAVYRAVWDVGTPAPRAISLTTEEWPVLEKVAEAFFPGPPEVPLRASDIGLTSWIDRYMGQLYVQEQRLYKWVLRGLEMQSLVLSGQPFSAAPLAKCQRQLQRWSNSKVPLRKSAYQSLRWTCSMGYFENPQVREQLGLSLGCPLPGRI